MKVLIATAMYPTAANPAFGSFVRTQAEALRKAGIDVDVLVLEGQPRKLIYPRGIFQLRTRLKNSPVNIIHAHYSYAGMVARAQLRVPLIVTYHGSDLLGTINKRGQQTVFSRATVLAGQVLSCFADAVIVQSKEMARRLKRKDVYLIPQEVDCETFKPQCRDEARTVLNLDADKKYVLFAADPNNPVKHYALARATAENLRLEDPSIELLVVFRETQPRLALHMNACDALIFTSYQEGSPVIVKQAMACNLPIVATDVGDVRERIGGTDGCQICEATVSAFAASLRQVLRCRSRTRGRERVLPLASEATAKKVICVYEQTLSNRFERVANGRAAGNSF